MVRNSIQVVEKWIFALISKNVFFEIKALYGEGNLGVEFVSASRVIAIAVRVAILVLCLLESLQGYYQYWWSPVKLQVLGGETVLLALPAIPHVLLIKVLRFVEFFEAVLQGDVFFFMSGDLVCALVDLLLFLDEGLAGVVGLEGLDGEVLAPEDVDLDVLEFASGVEVVVVLEAGAHHYVFERGLRVEGHRASTAAALVAEIAVLVEAGDVLEDEVVEEGTLGLQLLVLSRLRSQLGEDNPVLFLDW